MWLFPSPKNRIMRGPGVLGCNLMNTKNFKRYMIMMRKGKKMINQFSLLFLFISLCLTTIVKWCVNLIAISRCKRFGSVHIRTTGQKSFCIWLSIFIPLWFNEIFLYLKIHSKIRKKRLEIERVTVKTINFTMNPFHFYQPERFIFLFREN